MTPVSIDPHAYAFARAMSAETGWRASEIYDIYVGVVGDVYTHQAVEQALGFIRDHRIDGESFNEAVDRIADIADAVNARRHR